MTNDSVAYDISNKDETEEKNTQAKRFWKEFNSQNEFKVKHSITYNHYKLMINGGNSWIQHQWNILGVWNITSKLICKVRTTIAVTCYLIHVNIERWAYIVYAVYVIRDIRALKIKIFIHSFAKYLLLFVVLKIAFDTKTHIILFELFIEWISMGSSWIKLTDVLHLHAIEDFWEMK